MTEMFGLLKELTTSKTLEKVLIREEAKLPVTKNVDSISLTKGEEERSNKMEVTPDNTEKHTEIEAEMLVKEAEKRMELKTRPETNQSKNLRTKKQWMHPVLNLSGPIYDTILKKKITKKEDIGGNFEIPCSMGGLKHVKALVDQGSKANVMPYSTYVKLTDERPIETDIRLSLASHS
ncbi:hypothetical protein Tco_1297317 [Tanacetum coccineum]